MRTLAAEQSLVTIHVAILSITGFASRILTGILSDLASKYLDLKHSFWAFFASLCMGISFYMTLELKTPNDLLYVTLLQGISYGSIWTISPSLIGLFFGQGNFNFNWGCMTMLPAFGGYLFSYIFGNVFDKQWQNNCKGADCFKASSEVAMTMCGISCILCFFLYRAHHSYL